jgi:hypothetical protein
VSLVPPVPLDDNLSAFFERRLHYRFQIGITQELVSQFELSIELPFGTWQWLWHVRFLVTYTTRSVRRPRFIHSTYRLSPAIGSIFPFSARSQPGGEWPRSGRAGLPRRRRPRAVGILRRYGLQQLDARVRQIKSGLGEVHNVHRPAR